MLWTFSFIIAHFPVKHFMFIDTARNWNVSVKECRHHKWHKVACSTHYSLSVMLSVLRLIIKNCILMTLKTSTGLLFPHWQSTGNDKGIVKHKIQWCQWSSQLESVFNWKQFWFPISKGGSTFHKTGKFGTVACSGGQKWIEMEERKQGSSPVICFARLFSAAWCNDNQWYAIRTLMLAVSTC